MMVGGVVHICGSDWTFMELSLAVKATNRNENSSGGHGGHGGQARGGGKSERIRRPI